MKTQSSQYIERQVPIRTVADMVREMEQELIDLPRFQAYAKRIQNREGEQVTLKQKMVTFPFSGEWVGHEYEDMLSHIKIRMAGDGFIRRRSVVQAEFAQRQVQWRDATGARNQIHRRGEPPKFEGLPDDPPPSHS